MQVNLTDKLQLRSLNQLPCFFTIPQDKLSTEREFAATARK